jgi:hypothetical protein
VISLPAQGFFVGLVPVARRRDALALDLELSSCIFRLMKGNLLQGTLHPHTHAHAGRTPSAAPHRRPVAVLTEAEGPWLGGSR